MLNIHEVEAQATAERSKVRFVSDDADCVAWHYPGSNGACVIMAGGFAVTKEPATDLFAAAFNDVGYSVLAFDYRRLGESGGRPRQMVRIADQLADWDAAIELAGSLPGVDPTRLGIWSFSLSGGHIFPVAARHPELGAAIAQTPLADGPAATRNAMRYTTTMAALRLSGRGIADALRGLAGRDPRLVPLVGPPGTVAVLTTPEALDGDRALNPGNRYPGWLQSVAARSALRVGFYRPGRHAPRVACPLLVLTYDDDQSALARPAARAAQRAPRGELFQRAGQHYEAFLDGHAEAVEVQLDFLRRHLIDRL